MDRHLGAGGETVEVQQLVQASGGDVAIARAWSSLVDTAEIARHRDLIRIPGLHFRFEHALVSKLAVGQCVLADINRIQRAAAELLHRAFEARVGELPYATRRARLQAEA